MITRRNFFGMLGGTAAAVPVAQLQAIAPEASAIEIRPASRYLLIFRFKGRFRDDVLPYNIDRQLREFLDDRGLPNVRGMVIDDTADVELYRLDAPQTR